MSTTLEQGRKRRQSQQNYAEFDEYISYQLQKTRSGIRLTDIFTALCGVAVLVVTYLLAFVIFDHWVITGGFSQSMRVVLLSVLGLATAVWLGWKVVWPYFQRVNALFAAKSLEQISPDLQSTLINYVDLRAAGREVAPEIIGSLEKRAAVTLSHTEVDDAVDRRLLLQLSYALLVAVVLFSLYAMFSPKKIWPSIVRIFAPAAEVSVSTQTGFLQVEPGDVQVLSRQVIEITADLIGETPEDVTLLYTTADQQFVDEPIVMREVEPGLKRYRCILKGATGEGLLQNQSYRIVAGDASTRTYEITVSQPPSATVTALQYSFPDYMELPPENAPGPNIDTWEGTRIEIEASTNMPVSFAKLQLSDEEQFPENPEEKRMELSGDGKRLSLMWQPIIRDDGSYPHFYRIQVRTKGNASDPSPSIHKIELKRDQKPDISTVQPNGDIEVAANAVVPLLLTAEDPDFRLSEVLLHLELGNRPLPKRSLYKGTDRKTRVVTDLRIGDLNANPGDVITWWAEARDNRVVDGNRRRLLDANRSLTPKLRMIVKAPVSPEEAKEQHQFDKQRVQEKLDELEQQVGDSGDSSEPLDRPDEREFDSRDENPTDPGESEPREQSDPQTDEPQSNGDDSSSDGRGSSAETNENSESESGSSAGTETSETSEDGREASTQSPDGESGQRPSDQPVSNDGSQDDEVLRELLNRAREQDSEGTPDPNRSSDGRPDSEPGETGTPDTGSNTGDSTDPGTPQNNEPGDNRPSENDPDPGTGDNATDPNGPENRDPTTGSNEPGSPEGNPDSSPPSEASQPGDGTESPQTPNEQPSTPDSGSPESDPTSPNSDSASESSSNESSPDGQNMPSEGTPGAESEPSTPPNQNSGQNPDQPTGSGQSSDSTHPGGNDRPDSPTQTDGSSQPSDDTGSSNPSESGSDSSNPDGEQSGSSSSSPDDGRSNSSSGMPGDGSSSSSTPPNGNSSNPGDGSSSSENANPGGSDSSSQPSGNAGTGEGTPSESGPTDSASPSSDSGSSESGSQNSESTSSTSESGSDGASESDLPDNKGTPGSSESPESGSSESGPSESGSESSGQPSGSESSSKSSGKGESGSEGKGKGESSGSGTQGERKGQRTGEAQGNPSQGKGGGPQQNSGQVGRRPDDNADVEDAVERPHSGANATSAVKEADKANLDDKLKASNMVLKRLKEELDRGEVDPELLKKLGWTERDMQRFAERLERQLAQPKPDDPNAAARRRQFEEMLRSVDLDSAGGEKSGEFRQQKSTRNFSDRRLPVPRGYKEAYEQYLKRLSGQRLPTQRSAD